MRANLVYIRVRWRR